MTKIKKYVPITGLILAVLFTAGCLVISGTFIIKQDFELTAVSGFYFYAVDITETDEWSDHSDKLDFVDAVGLEFVIENNTDSEVTFNAYLDESTASPTVIPTAAEAIIIENFVVPPGTTKISYAQSLTILRNLDRIKELVKSGMFNYYSTSTANDGADFLITEGVVIITFSASST